MESDTPRILLPKSWTKHVRSGVLHVISLAQFTTAYTRGWAANSTTVASGSEPNWIGRTRTSPSGVDESRKRAHSLDAV
jgi:hypothetical protein